MLIALVMLGIIVAIGIGFAVRGINRGIAAAETIEAEKIKSLSDAPGFSPAVIYDGLPGTYGLAIDPVSSRFAIAIPGAKARIYAFNQLVAAEIDRSGATVTTTRGKVDTSGAALATAIIGPVGGLLAGAKTTSTSTSIEQVSLALKLYVNDLHSPCFKIPFGSGSTHSSDTHLAGIIERLDAWYGRFRTITAGNDADRHRGIVGEAIVHDEAAPPPTAIPWSGRVFAR